MTAAEFREFLAAAVQFGVMSAVVKLPGGAEFQVAFNPPVPVGLPSAPEPGGWKTSRLDTDFDQNDLPPRSNDVP